MSPEHPVSLEHQVRRAADLAGRITFGVVTALEKEYVAVKAMLTDPVPHHIPGRGAGRQYLLGEVPAKGGGNHAIAMVMCEQGNSSASARGTLLIEHFPSIQSVLMVGIAGGVPHPAKHEHHVRLGDIVVTGEMGVIKYDFIKEHSKWEEARHPPRAPSPRLLESTKHLLAGALEGRYPWETCLATTELAFASRPKPDTDVLADSGNPNTMLTHPTDPARREGKPRVFVGAVACADRLLKNPAHRDLLRDEYKVRAVEMESSGVAEATWNHDIGYIAIRGICDYCDGNKGDEWQGYAAVAAASFAKALLQETYPTSILKAPPTSASSLDITGSFSVVAEPLLDNLPSREAIVDSFVGRRSELAALRSWLDQPERRRHTLVGEGGLGKTALAYQLACDLKYNPRGSLRAVFWLSAKKKRFFEGETIDIVNPDFASLDSAVSRLLECYGQTAGIEDNAGRVAKLLNILDDHPALVVVDDIDSLEGVDEAAVEFFTFRAPQTKSKVLMTSRRMILGMGTSTTQVHGLAEDDAKEFVGLQCKRAGINTSILTAVLMRDILTASSCSPLYIEDLIRFFFVSTTPQEAIDNWKTRTGDEAREYALGREFEKLTPRARSVLLAACIYKGKITLSRLRILSNLSKEAVEGALNELYRLFLVPRPSLSEGEPCFDVNLNTRALVTRLAEAKYPQLYNSVSSAYAAMTGEAPKGAGQTMRVLRRAYFFVKGGDYGMAESLIKDELGKRPADPQLLAYLGFVYKVWEPPRVTDAREAFERASQLKWTAPEMYTHWCEMECRLQEWTRAAEAAERGLSFSPSDVALLQLAGYARSRLAKELQRQLLRERAFDEVRKANMHLKQGLECSVDRRPETRQYRAKIFKTLVLNAEIVGDVDGIKRLLDKWRRDFPNDDELQFLQERLGEKFDF